MELSTRRAPLGYSFYCVWSDVQVDNFLFFSILWAERTSEDDIDDVRQHIYFISQCYSSAQSISRVCIGQTSSKVNNALFSSPHSLDKSVYKNTCASSTRSPWIPVDRFQYAGYCEWHFSLVDRSGIMSTLLTHSDEKTLHKARGTSFVVRPPLAHTASVI